MQRQIQQQIVERKDITEVFVFFSGKGITHLHGHDEQTKISLEKIKQRFDFQFAPNTGCFGLNGLHLDEQIAFFSHELFGVLQ